jgi:hypothetical protein
MIKMFQKTSKMTSAEIVQKDVANTFSDPYMRAQHKPEAYTEVEALTMLRSEQRRRETFRSWTSSAVQPKELARAGFIYNGMGDRVQCVFCLMQMENWEKDDDPTHEHKQFGENCPFVCGKAVGNVPIGQKDANWEVTPLSGFGYNNENIRGIRRINLYDGGIWYHPKEGKPVEEKYELPDPKPAGRGGTLDTHMYLFAGGEKYRLP